MISSFLSTLLALAMLVAGVYSGLEVLNDDTVIDVDNLNLQDDYLLPIGTAVNQNKNRQQSTTSIKQNEKENKTPEANIKIHQQGDAKSHNPTDSKTKVEVLGTHETYPSNSSPKSATKAEKKKDLVLTGEDFMSVEDKNYQPSANSRKLAEFTGSTDSSEESETTEKASDDAESAIMKTACQHANSWECLMFQQDPQDMMGDANLSHLSAKERVKRQSGSNTGTTANSRATQNNLKGCENDECFSGDDPNADVLEYPDYVTSPTPLQYQTNKTKLTPEEKNNIAKELEEKLRDVFKNTTGFKDVRIDPSKIKITPDGVITVPWDLIFDGQDPEFSGKNPDEIRNIVNGSLQNVGDAIKNRGTLFDQKPINDFDPNAALKDIMEQVLNPCKNNPCPSGYGLCVVKNPGTVLCRHNCNLHPKCQHGGTCQLDHNGKAICQCRNPYTGKDCQDRVRELDGGRIAGITLGAALIAASAITCLCCLLMIMRRRPVNYTHYCDQEGSGQFSTASAKLYCIDRPAVSATPNSIYGQANYNNFSSQSSNASFGESPPADPYSSA